MHERPGEFKWLAWLMGLICVSLPLQVALEYGYGPIHWAEILTALAPWNWMLIATALVCALLSLRASPMLLVAVPAFALTLVLNNWVVAATGANVSPELALLGVGAGLLPTFLLLTRRSRKVLTEPRSRWWLTPKRRRARISVAVRPVLADEWSILKTATFDVSEGGAFISQGAFTGLECARGRAASTRLEPGARCTVRLTLSQFHVIQCGAQVIRKSEREQGGYPPGFAVRFVGLDSWQRDVLAQYVRRELPDLAA